MPFSGPQYPQPAQPVFQPPSNNVGPMPGGSINTGYDGNRINVNTQVPGSPTFDTSSLDGLLASLLTSPQQQRPGPPAPSRPPREIRLGGGGGQERPAQVYGRGGGRPQGEPIFTRELAGFNMSGLTQAQPWERGAAFSGHYTQPGKSAMPDSSQFIGAGSPLTAPGISQGGGAGRSQGQTQADAIDNWYNTPEHIRRQAMIAGGYGAGKTE